MNAVDIRQSLIEFLSELVPNIVVHDGDEQRTLEDLGLDSLDVSGFLLKIEETYEIRITDEDFKSLVCLDDYVGIIERRKSNT